MGLHTEEGNSLKVSCLKLLRYAWNVRRGIHGMVLMARFSYKMYEVSSYKFNLCNKITFILQINRKNFSLLKPNMANKQEQRFSRFPFLLVSLSEWKHHERKEIRKKKENLFIDELHTPLEPFWC